jgi:hypothetical protein
MAEPEKEPTQTWITTFSGTAINLCLGMLYAWSMWGNRHILSGKNRGEQL